MISAKLPALILLITIASSANAQVKAGTMVRNKVVEVQDSIEFYEVEFTSNQKSYMNLLEGTWNITGMKKPSYKDIITLTDVTLTLNKDSSFTGMAPCNKISGKFSIKGTSIRFGDIATTRITCPKQEEENTLLQVLKEGVSNYSVTKPSLLFRNGSGVVVIEATRR
jgi:putative lipoprotein